MQASLELLNQRESMPTVSLTLQTSRDQNLVMAVTVHRQGALTGRDSFVMGPSGFGFLHPSIISPADPLVDALVNRTIAAAALLSAQGVFPPRYCDTPLSDQVSSCICRADSMLALS